MDIKILMEKPLWQMTGREVLYLQLQAASTAQQQQPTNSVSDAAAKHYVYGIAGIARLFGCSTATANRIKKSGKIDAAIRQLCRKIVVDADLALELAGRKSGGRCSNGQ